MKYVNRICALFLTALFMISSMPLSVFAAETNTPKEEVVYINMNQDGSVREIYVVNIFDLDENGQIIDYGEYETLRNMTTTDEIGYSDSKVTIDAEAGKLYYEGKLSSDVMPWNIEIHYYMDDIEYSAADIAGKSGTLKIAMSIRENKNCNRLFFEEYALQATFVLDTEFCKDIVAENATIANVGSDKQITFTILPNKETDIEITAKVELFEMTGIAINGIPLNLNIEVEDAELQEKITQIMDAVKEIDEGTEDLYEGSSDLYEGAVDLYEGMTELSEGAVSLSDGAGELFSATGTLHEKVGELHEGVGTLSDGAGELYSGLSALAEKNTELTEGAWSAYSALCTAAQTQLNAELVANGFEAVAFTPDNYSVVLEEVLSKMDAELVYEQAYNVALREVTAQVESQAHDLYKGYIQSQADILYMQIASKTVYEQFVGAGYTVEQAEAYLQTAEGQSMVAKAVASMTVEQKQQVLEGACTSLTEEQKMQIRTAYIEQMMSSEEVIQRIDGALVQSSEATKKITELKGQLDAYGAFYQGLLVYTAGVSDITTGANSVQGGLNTLYLNTGTLKSSVGELDIATGELSEGASELKKGAEELNDGAKKLSDGAKELNDGVKELNDGTGEFVAETSGMDTEVSDEIDSLIASIAGSNSEIVSFVSDKNTEIKSVQFVIKTDAIQIKEVENVDAMAEESLNFWQKLLRLFGLY